MNETAAVVPPFIYTRNFVSALSRLQGILPRREYLRDISGNLVAIDRVIQTIGVMI